MASCASWDFVLRYLIVTDEKKKNESVEMRCQMSYSE